MNRSSGCRCHRIAKALGVALLGAGAAAGAGDRGAAPLVSYEDAMAAGTHTVTYYRPGDKLNRRKIEFGTARAQFARALELAGSDREAAAALLAIGASSLNDVTQTNVPAIRAGFERVLALAAATPRQRAEAALGVGETHVRECAYDAARAQFAKAIEGAETPGDAVPIRYALAYSYLQQRRFDDARREFTALLEGGLLGEPLAWRVAALRDALDLVPRVRRMRPRMFFNADTWPAVKAKALTGEKAAFDELAARVAALRAADLVPRDWGMEAMDAAFVYRVTGDAGLLETVRRLVRASLDFYLGRSVFRGRMYEQAGCAAALDWVWNDLAPDERLALARDFINYSHAMDTEDRVQLDGLFGMLNASDYYIRAIPWYAGLATFDDALDDVTYGRAFTALARGFRQYRGFLDTAREDGGDDGAARTMLGYYFAETLNTVWPYFYCWESAMGTPIAPEHMYYLSPDYILRSALAFTPRIVNFNYGKTWNDARGMRHDLLYDHLAHMLHFYSRPYPVEMTVVSHIRQRMEAARATGRGLYSIYPFLRDLSQAPAPALPPNLPVARHFEHVGQVLMSSGFGDDDTYALFSCGDNRDYGQPDATHFAIWRGGYLAVDSGSLGQGINTNNFRENAGYYLQTVAHNCVLIHLPDERIYGTFTNYGGQCRDPGFATLRAFESRGRDYAYMATDATPVYSAEKCAEMVRQLVYLPPAHVVVFDRVTATRPEYAKAWLLHTANEPMFNGRAFRADEGRGRLFCRTLEPEDAVLEPVGGPGREFWAAGRNWPLQPGALHAMGTDRPENVPASMGRWRVEVKPGAARATDWFLHLLQTADPATPEMSASARRATADRLGLEFAAGPRTVTLDFNRAGEIGGHIRIVEGGRTLVDRPLTTAVMPQAGLALDP